MIHHSMIALIYFHEQKCLEQKLIEWLIVIKYFDVILKILNIWRTSEY